MRNYALIGSLCTLILIFSISACTPTIRKTYPTDSSFVTVTEQILQTTATVPSKETETPLGLIPATELIYPTGAWKTYPIVPILSPRAVGVFKAGLTMGNNPHAFSKVGDGEVATSWFLTVYDLESDNYNLGPFPELASVLEYFAGSFGRESLATRAGFNTTRILDPLFVMNDICEVEESPLECELRRHRPSFAIISLGTNQVWTPEVFEAEMRQIVEICIERGVLPILATKGDNLEGDHRINAIIAHIAVEYEVPLWNFWLALQSLPDRGLQTDGEHLTWAENDFDSPEAMTHAWPVRNLTALKVLDVLINQLASD
jgi:hypothetical protein